MRLAKTVFGTAMTVGLLVTGAQAASIIGFGDPLSHPSLTGGTQQGFDAVTAGQYGVLTLGNVTYRGVDLDFVIDDDFNGSFNTTGGRYMSTDSEGYLQIRLRDSSWRFRLQF